MTLCPFCQDRPANSDDHVFPQFLGGHSITVDACRQCNSMFGHCFEGPASRAMAPLFVGLTWCGIEQVGEPVWRKALVHDGLDYDLNANLKGTLSRPQIKRDDKGKFIGGRFPIWTKREKFGPKAKVKIEREQTEIKLDQSEFPMELNVGLRQLATKMAVGFCLHRGLERKHIAQSTFDFLRTPQPTISNVSLDLRVHQALDALVPHLSHVIHVCGAPEQQRLYGVVQFFSAFQFYVPLHTAYDGPVVSWLGTLNVKTKEEAFSEVPLLSIEPAPIHITDEEYQLGLTNWFARYNTRLAKLSNGKHFTLSPPRLGTTVLTPGLTTAVVHRQLTTNKLTNLFCSVHNKPAIIGQIENDPVEGPGFSMDVCCDDFLKRVFEVLSSGATAHE